ncbi:MAG: hypothetical protein ACQKBY_12380 [Verrucomicrobiales bacterium]
MTPEEQDAFDFDQSADDSGYQNWQASLEEEKRRLEVEHGLILGLPVRVQLRGHAREIEGPIRHRLSNGQLILSLGTLDFSPDDIISLVKV